MSLTMTWSTKPAPQPVAPRKPPSRTTCRHPTARPADHPCRLTDAPPYEPRSVAVAWPSSDVLIVALSEKIALPGDYGNVNDYFWMPIVVPLVGAAIGAFIYDLFIATC
jgi:hypothetical protein